MFERLLDELDVLTEYDKREGLFQILDDFVVEAISERAALINGQWLAKSQMRTDLDGNLYLSCWLYAKVF